MVVRARRYPGWSDVHKLFVLTSAQFGNPYFNRRLHVLAIERVCNLDAQ